MKMFLEESLELDRNTVQYKIERIPTHSRYFSDELDAQIFYSKKEHMFTSGTICAKI